MPTPPRLRVPRARWRYGRRTQAGGTRMAVVRCPSGTAGRRLRLLRDGTGSARRYVAARGIHTPRPKPSASRARSIVDRSRRALPRRVQFSSASLEVLPIAGRGCLRAGHGSCCRIPELRPIHERGDARRKRVVRSTEPLVFTAAVTTPSSLTGTVAVHARQNVVVDLQPEDIPRLEPLFQGRLGRDGTGVSIPRRASRLVNPASALTLPSASCW